MLDVVILLKNVDVIRPYKVPFLNHTKFQSIFRIACFSVYSMVPFTIKIS